MIQRRVFVLGPMLKAHLGRCLRLFMLILSAVVCIETPVQTPALAEEPASAPIIFDVLFDGLKRVDKDVIMGAMVSRIGKPLDRQRLAEDIHNIFRTNFFRDVTVKTVLGTGNVVLLVFQLKEKPAIKEIVIEGNDDVSKDDIKGVMDVKQNTILNADQLARNASKIRELYVFRQMLKHNHLAHLVELFATCPLRNHQRIPNLFWNLSCQVRLILVYQALFEQQQY